MSPPEVPVSGLTERLLRRSNGLVGVIDVRHGGRIHDRTAGWLAPKLEMLNNLKNRYGMEQDADSAPGASWAGFGAMPFITPLQMAAGVTAAGPGDSLPPALPQAARTAMPAIAPDASSGDVAAPRQFRVRRPGATPDSHGDPPRTEGIQRAAEIGIQPGPALPAPPLHLQRKAIDPPQNQDVSRNPVPASVPPTAPAGVPVHAVSPASLPRVVETPPAAEPALLLRKSDGDAAAPTSQGPAAVLPSIEPSLSPSPSPVSAAVPRVVELRTASGPAPVLAQPLSGQTPSGRVTEGKSIRATEGGADRPAAKDITRPPAVASSLEIRVAPRSPDSTPMVWRKAEPGAAAVAAPPPAGVTYAPGPQIMRVINAGSSASESDVAPAVEQSGGGRVDVQQVAEQVTRIIARQLVVEAERRGRSK